MNRAIISLLAVLSVAAGGVVPDGMGGWDNGARDPIPPSSSRLTWSSHSSFTPEQRDWIMFAFATWDLELVGMSLPRSPTWDSQVQVRTTVQDDVACSTPGQTCKLGEASCDAYGEVAGSAYRICEQYRLTIYQNNVNRFADARGLSRFDVFFSVTRHEIGHALGIDHGSGIMTAASPINGYKGHVGQAPATACQVATLSDYFLDLDATMWAYVPAPLECQP